MTATEYPFNPDWTVAPAATLREWLAEHHMTSGELAARCFSYAEGHGLAEVNAAIVAVLNKQPMAEWLPPLLGEVTGARAAFWWNLETIYRDDLAAGRKDVTGGG